MFAAKAASVGLAALVLGACASAPQVDQSSIGVAEIDSSGIITLRLSSYEADGTHVQGNATYRPGDPHYDEVLAHIGGIAPGEIKPVRPWPARGPGGSKP